PAPQTLSRRCIIRVEKTTSAKLASRHTDDDFIFHNERGTCDAVAKHRVGRLCFPQKQTCSRIDGDNRCIERADEQAIAEYGHSPVEWINFVWITHFPLARESPDLPAAPGVEREDSSGLAAR